jgi:tight adherence protein B
VTLLLALGVVGAALLGLPLSPRRRLGRLRISEPTAKNWSSLPIVGVAVSVVGAGLVGLGFFGMAGAAVGLCTGLLAATAMGLWRRQRRGQRAARRTEAVVDACQLLAGLLRVGHVSAMALRIAATDSEVFVEAEAAQRLGGSVPAVLRRHGAQPGGGGLTELAIAWEVSQRTGASMTATLDALSERLEEGRKIARVVDSELSAPRATGRLLAALPLFGLLLGYAIGGDPGAFLLSSPAGQLCLVIGVSLACAGVWWIERIAGSAGG